MQVPGPAGLVNMSTGVMDKFGGTWATNMPPALYQNLAIVAGRTGEQGRYGTPGDPRAFDLLTGKEVWRFHGAAVYASPPKAFRLAIRVFAHAGFTQAKVDLITKQNPARFLGLKQSTSHGEIAVGKGIRRPGTFARDGSRSSPPARRHPSRGLCLPADCFSIGLALP